MDGWFEHVVGLPTMGGQSAERESFVSARKILVVDDDSLLRQLFSLLLSHEGFTVLCAEDGREAVELMAQAPDLVISDLVMPVMDGRMFIDEIEAVCRASGRETPPVLLMSASPDLLREFQARGMVTLDKPVDPVRFVEAVRSVLNA